ncbi:hypothetical protein [Wukongibacter sp. M2B1]|uniref:hypothetical protein n=1 Tax=Wukongibacter sp. M2B1 TaxID=3088895 RepID=UPI003D79C678
MITRNDFNFDEGGLFSLRASGGDIDGYRPVEFMFSIDDKGNYEGKYDFEKAIYDTSDYFELTFEEE